MSWCGFELVDSSSAPSTDSTPKNLAKFFLLTGSVVSPDTFDSSFSTSFTVCNMATFWATLLSVSQLVSESLFKPNSLHKSFRLTGCWAEISWPLFDSMTLLLSSFLLTLLTLISLFDDVTLCKLSWDEVGVTDWHLLLTMIFGEMGGGRGSLLWWPLSDKWSPSLVPWLTNDPSVSLFSWGKSNKCFTFVILQNWI